ncbi:MAG: serine/threonine protein kinase [Myxococcales bacterium]|nr:serine/threonine protein kinase [Myxococcales bacterium]
MDEAPDESILDPNDEDPEADALLRRVARVDEIDPATRALEPGTQLGRFRVVRELGRGGMGIVYLADDTTLHRQVALKVLRPSLARDEAQRRLLVREARAAAAVSHPNIAAVFELGEAEGLVFLAMERVEGESLRLRIGMGGLDLEQVLTITEQVLAGLGTAHAAGLVHRDLKPENVLVTPDGVVKLLDFGLAKLAPRAPTSGGASVSLPTLEGSRAGTPAYMSPEQIVGDPVDARSDLFSFGVLTYELLSGRRPFTGDTLSALARAVVAADPPPLATLRPDLPAPLAAVVMRCLAKTPEDRPASAREVAEALLAAAHAPSPRRGRRRLLAAGVVAGSLAAAGLWLGLRGANDPSAAAPVAADQNVLRLDASATLACPVWEARGVREPAGWLGAAAGDLACELAAMRLSPPSANVRVPAALLGLPNMPTDGVLDDPFGAPDARARTLVATAGATLVLDGTVERGPTELTVTLIAEHGEREIGRARAKSTTLPWALWLALEELVERGVIVPPAEPLPVERYPTWADSPRAAGWAAALLVSLEHHAEATDECERFLAQPGEARLKRNLWYSCFPNTPNGGAGPPYRAFDESTDALTLAAQERDELTAEERAALRERIERARVIEPSPARQAALLDAEAVLWRQDGEVERARACSLSALKLLPGDDAAAQMLGNLARGTEHAARTARWVEAWVPYLLLSDITTPEDTLRLARRQYELTGLSDSLAGMALGPLLVAGGQVTEAQAVAADYLAGSPRLRHVGDMILAEVAFGEAAFGRGRRHLGRFLEATPLVKWSRQELTAVNRLLRLADAVGDSRATADDLLDRYLFDLPYDYERTWMWATLLGACVRTSHERAERCLARFEELERIDGYGKTINERYRSYVDGAAAVVRGDLRDAARAWGRLDPKDNFYPLIVDVSVFDSVGRAPDASAIDVALMDHRTGRFAGATPAHAREAFRAKKRGDDARARELAKLVTDAWGKSDIPMPVVEALRPLR